MTDSRAAALNLSGPTRKFLESKNTTVNIMDGIVDDYFSIESMELKPLKSKRPIPDKNPVESIPTPAEPPQEMKEITRSATVEVEVEVEPSGLELVDFREKYKKSSSPKSTTIAAEHFEDLASERDTLPIQSSLAVNDPPTIPEISSKQEPEAITQPTETLKTPVEEKTPLETSLPVVAQEVVVQSIPEIIPFTETPAVEPSMQPTPETLKVACEEKKPTEAATDMKIPDKGEPKVPVFFESKQQIPTPIVAPSTGIALGVNSSFAAAQTKVVPAKKSSRSLTQFFNKICCCADEKAEVSQPTQKP